MNHSTETQTAVEDAKVSVADLLRGLYTGACTEAAFVLEACSQDPEDHTAYRLTCRTEFSAPESSSSLVPAARTVSVRPVNSGEA